VAADHELLRGPGTGQGQRGRLDDQTGRLADEGSAFGRVVRDARTDEARDEQQAQQASEKAAAAGEDGARREA